MITPHNMMYFIVLSSLLLSNLGFLREFRASYSWFWEEFVMHS